MILEIFVVFFSLVGLIVLHELGHFLLAKKFGVKVEEFGIFLPPRLFGKKIGETIYSLNLLPFGAFVRIYGEEDSQKRESFAFGAKPIWQRMLIVVGGVISFWLVAAILLSFVMALGFPIAVSDQVEVPGAHLQIASVFPNSPAQKAGLKMGDVILEIKGPNFGNKEVDKLKEFQGMIENFRGKRVTLTIKRGKEIFDVSLIPRSLPPKNEGPMGVVLIRTTLKQYPWYQAALKGIITTARLTCFTVLGLGKILKNFVLKKSLPPGAKIMGPVGIGGLMLNFTQLGTSYYLHLLALLSIYLAIFNILPIPALDGGKLLFLGIEAIRKKPISPKIEQRITTAFFFFLILIAVVVTVKDIVRLF